jgi:hypothetical protein
MLFLLTSPFSSLLLLLLLPQLQITADWKAPWKQEQHLQLCMYQLVRCKGGQLAPRNGTLECAIV